MKQTILIPIFAFFAFNLSAQNEQRILCGQDLLRQIAEEHYPEWQKALDKTFQSLRENPPADDRSPLKINVVVHIVWKGTDENLDDSIILNQIKVLNEDFNRLNADTANLRNVFKPAAGNPQIEFKLAQVIRKHTTATFSIDVLGGGLLSELKSSAKGGSDAIDPEKFLNIWVCKIQPTTIFGVPVGQILGFAFPPNGLPNWPAESSAPKPEEDGVVIDYRVFGRNNPHPLTNPAGGGNLVVKGRTPVHEVGHYLGLRHIWGDGGILGLPNDCAQSDGIDDTPFASSQSSFDCDKTRNTCEVSEAFYNADVPDLIENYMDYSAEDCMNMFTKGQAAHMRASLQGPRKGLLEASSGVQFARENIVITLAPNPADQHVDITLPGSVSDARLTLSACNGGAVFIGVLPSGERSIRIPVDQLPEGIYFLRIDSREGYATQKLIVR